METAKAVVSTAVGAGVGMGTSAVIGGVGLAIGGTAIGIGLLPFAAGGAVIGGIAYGAHKLFGLFENKPNLLKMLRHTVSQRARQIWEESGKISGRDQENWDQAGLEVLEALASQI